MKYQELLTKINAYYQKIGIPQFPSAPIIHEGFPGNFNLSLTEYEFLQQQSGFLGLNKDMRYVKNQPCVRKNDLKYISNLQEDSYRYLLRFTMASVGGIFWLKDSSKKDKMAHKVITNTINFLVKECSLDIKKIYIEYLKPTTIFEMTEGKYNFDYDIPVDPNLRHYQKLDIPKENFIPANNRNALLALNIYGRPTPWGYRNEIYYKYKGKLLDIATVEDLRYFPIFKKDAIVDLKHLDSTLAIGAIGVERLLLILNNLENINQLDIISEPAAILRPYLDPKDAAQLVQTLRAIQLIIADSGGYDSLSDKRKEKIREFYKFLDLKVNNVVPDEILIKVMKKIAETEPNLPQLNQAVEQNLEEFKKYKLRIRFPYSWQKHLSEIKR
ncbi:MAG: hypothetical protein PHW50_02630 [Patescibacteria group bacterium]|nr:hypothetical protein [Patescibacteria group bacterium]